MLDAAEDVKMDMGATIIPQRERATSVIEDFLHQELRIKKSLKNLEMENEKLKNILKQIIMLITFANKCDLKIRGVG